MYIYMHTYIHTYIYIYIYIYIYTHTYISAHRAARDDAVDLPLLRAGGAAAARVQCILARRGSKCKF